ncbi:uncharacterized protein PFL1_01325 [Pseudozyma flocculosa PF-1]|uniref:uncharacterized protein n=1 Tax=Pseudozyma flocculosa PF-1 TaxID=1277687 RepID=UPI0004560F2B|nr:uncharacterized protein PFL1_01325 [Pseudozyma flocculosa PF-1]EPQ31136.1 hypothetical protein PFL1_01325 [Pseudozyma flocculosa PF-1]
MLAPVSQTERGACQAGKQRGARDPLLSCSAAWPPAPRLPFGSACSRVHGQAGATGEQERSKQLSKPGQAANVGQEGMAGKQRMGVASMKAAKRGCWPDEVVNGPPAWLREA